jgi:hypothetical protein
MTLVIDFNILPNRERGRYGLPTTYFSAVGALNFSSIYSKASRNIKMIAGSHWWHVFSLSLSCSRVITHL